MSERMQAAVVHGYGSPEVFAIEEVARPVPGPRDVLIEVHAASVNPIDWKIRKGTQRGAIRTRFPAILGMDASGIVAATGRDVTRFRVGDAVYTSPTHRRPGTYAEYVAVDERAVARKPVNLSHQEAASLPLAGLSAWECLVRCARVGPGQKVLVLAGSGGVGSLGVQIARLLGAEVAATCSARNVELVRGLGADIVVDYGRERFDERLSGYDVVVDGLGGEDRERAFTVLRRGGTLASLVSGLPANTERWGPNLGLLVTGLEILALAVRGRLAHGVRARNVVRRADGAALAQLTGWVEAGKLRPVIDRVLPLAEIAEAHRFSESGRARGKIVIAVRPEAS